MRTKAPIQKLKNFFQNLNSLIQKQLLKDVMKFAIIGDYIIDEFINYTSIKISPESPCPVVKLKSSKILPGGAANVANSCNKIGLDFSFIFCTEINKNQNILKCSNNTFKYTRKDFIQSHKKRHCVDNIQFFREDKETISK